MKRCYKCDETKPLDDFNKARSRRDGRQDQCRACERAYRTANKEAILVRKAAYYEQHKEAVRARHVVYREQNKAAIRAYRTAYREENKEAIRARERVADAKWRAANRAYWATRDPWLEHPTGRKECRRGHGSLPVSAFSRDSARADGLRRDCRECADATGETKADREAWRELARIRPPCVYCGGPSEHTDHVIPASRGGRDIASNYAPACAADNLSKNDRWVFDFLFDTTLEPDEAKPTAFKTWDARFLAELFVELARHEQAS